MRNHGKMTLIGTASQTETSIRKMASIRAISGWLRVLTMTLRF
jgi:hypothetical protein